MCFTTQCTTNDGSNVQQAANICHMVTYKNTQKCYKSGINQQKGA